LQSSLLQIPRGAVGLLPSMCCCTRLHRHQIHLISYGCVSFGLITTGLVFTVFAIFQKDSQIGKVWLAGPTTMVVGLVLCGKVIIDWGPAMMHAREGSIDSRLDEHLAQLQLMKAPPNNNHGYHHLMRGSHIPMRLPEAETELGMSAAGLVHPLHPAIHHQNSLVFANVNASSPTLHSARNGHVRAAVEHPDCIIYSQYESPTPHGSTSGADSSSVHHSQLSTHTSSSATIVSPEHSVKESSSCGYKYGSIKKIPPMRTMFQGESFVMNERSF
ncbi:hypothetical protein PMAYCL1PPCAC_31415, partial [Pristionchus mayeri]